MYDSRLTWVENQSHDQLRATTHVLQAAQHNHLSTDYLLPNLIKILFRKLESQALDFDCELLIQNPLGFVSIRDLPAVWRNQHTSATTCTNYSQTIIATIILSSPVFATNLWKSFHDSKRKEQFPGHLYHGRPITCLAICHPPHRVSQKR
jgi:hypothetical protein